MLPDVLEPGGYDLVFTGTGALCWLSDIERWAEIVAGPLAPCKRLVRPDQAGPHPSAGDWLQCSDRRCVPAST